MRSSEGAAVEGAGSPIWVAGTAAKSKHMREERKEIGWDGVLVFAGIC
jgi:hypothetical protein